ncbi:hypothetical protein PYV61_02280, partial [Roseisolibacter sp. H3M3-2]|nr:hypothetical protein [Roseisolibacter sp. H3M3-2]
VAVAQTVAVAHAAPRQVAAAALLDARLGAGAVYGGFHYGVDVVAGAALGLAGGALAARVATRQRAASASATAASSASPANGFST